MWMSAWRVSSSTTRYWESQVLLAVYSCRFDIHLRGCGLARILIHWSSLRKFFFRVFNFRGWPRPRNYFNSKIFPIYGTYSHTMYICTFGMQTMQCQSSVWGLRSSSRSSGVLPSIMWHFAAACHSQVSLSPLDGIFSCNFHDFHDGVHDVKHVRSQHNNLRLCWRVFWYSIRQGR